MWSQNTGPQFVEKDDQTNCIDNTCLIRSAFFNPVFPPKLFTDFPNTIKKAVDNTDFLCDAFFDQIWFPKENNVPDSVEKAVDSTDDLRDAFVDRGFKEELNARNHKPKCDLSSLWNFDSTQPSHQYGFTHNDNQISPKWNGGPIQKPWAHHYDAHFSSVRQQQPNVAPMQVPTTYHHSRSTKSVHAQQSNALKRSPLSHHNERSNEKWQHGRPKHNNFRAKSCNFCKNNGEEEHVYMSHSLKDFKGRMECPRLREHVCIICGKSGDEAHTLRYCPKRGYLV